MTLEEGDHMSQKVKEKLRDPRNVTGAEFAAPSDLNGYWDEPRMKFGLWVGESEEEAELVTFEIEGDQIDGFAEAFQRAAEDKEDLDS